MEAELKKKLEEALKNAADTPFLVYRPRRIIYEEIQQKMSMYTEADIREWENYRRQLCEQRDNGSNSSNNSDNNRKEFNPLNEQYPNKSTSTTQTFSFFGNNDTVRMYFNQPLRFKKVENAIKVFRSVCGLTKLKIRNIIGLIEESQSNVINAVSAILRAIKKLF